MIASAVAGGAIGTLAMATIIKAASELGLTRMDLALLLADVPAVLDFGFDGR